MSLAQKIKEYALDLGYCRAGITSADSFPDYSEAMKCIPFILTRPDNR